MATPWLSLRRPSSGYDLAACQRRWLVGMRMYADREGGPLEGAFVQRRTAPARDPDREVRIKRAGSVSRIERRIELTGQLSAEQRARLVEMADRCPIERSPEAGLEVLSVPGDVP